MLNDEFRESMGFVGSIPTKGERPDITHSHALKYILTKQKSQDRDSKSLVFLAV